MNRIPAQRGFLLRLISPLIEKEASTVCNIDEEGEWWVEHGDVRLAVHRSRYESWRTYLASPDKS